MNTQVELLKLFNYICSCQKEIIQAFIQLYFFSHVLISSTKVFWQNLNYFSLKKKNFLIY